MIVKAWPNRQHIWLKKKVDLIFSMSTPATLAVKKATGQTPIPVVFGPVNDPVQTGIVKEFRKHGSNMTGVAFGHQEVKRLEWLTRIVPQVKRIYIPFDPNDKSPLISISRLKDANTSLGLEMVFQEVVTEADLEAAMASLPSDIDAVFLPTDSFLAEKTPEFAQAAIARKLPLSCPHRPGVQGGALYSYGFDMEAIGRQSARLASQILRGIPPEDLPVEMAEFRLSINVRTANLIGLKLSDDILRQAIIYGR